MRKVSDLTWWVGYLVTLGSFGLLVAVFTQWADLNVWFGTIVIMAALAGAAFGFARIFALKEDD